MYRIWAPWIEPSWPGGNARPSHCAIVAQWARPCGGWRDGRLVGPVYHTFTPHVLAESMEAIHFHNHALRCCRAWNAAMLAAALTGLAVDTPALILADCLQDLEIEPALWRFLWEQFSPIGRPGRGPHGLAGAVPPVPVLYPDHLQPWIEWSKRLCLSTRIST